MNEPMLIDFGTAVDNGDQTLGVSYNNVTPEYFKDKKNPKTKNFDFDNFGLANLIYE